MLSANPGKDAINRPRCRSGKGQQTGPGCRRRCRRRCRPRRRGAPEYESRQQPCAGLQNPALPVLGGDAIWHAIGSKSLLSLRPSSKASSRLTRATPSSGEATRNTEDLDRISPEWFGPGVCDCYETTISSTIARPKAATSLPSSGSFPRKATCPASRFGHRPFEGASPPPSPGGDIRSKARIRSNSSRRPS